MSREDDALLYWAEAAVAVKTHFPGRADSAHHIARDLTWLEQVGYIISPSYHDELCRSYADRLAAAERAADELLYQIHDATGEKP